MTAATTEQCADRYRRQQLHEDQRSTELIASGEPSEDRNVDECRDQRDTHEEAHQQTAICRAVRERAWRHEWPAGLPFAYDEEHGADPGSGEQVRAMRRDCMLLRIADR